MPEVPLATPSLLRRVSAGAVLEFMRLSAAVTVTEVMEATGLTRATAIAVCEDLKDRRWIRELENQRAFGDYQKGRPARRFELNARAGVVLGLDIGYFKVTVVVSDKGWVRALRGPSRLIVHNGGPTGRLRYEGTLLRGKTQQFRGSRLWLVVDTPENLQLKVRGMAIKPMRGHRPRVIVVTPNGIRPAS